MNEYVKKLLDDFDYFFKNRYSSCLSYEEKLQKIKNYIPIHLLYKKKSEYDTGKRCSFHHIENPSHVEQLAAVSVDGLLLRFIKNPKEDVICAALKQNGASILWVKNPTKKHKFLSIKSPTSGAKYIDYLEADLLNLVKRNYPEIAIKQQYTIQEQRKLIKEDISNIFKIIKPNDKIIFNMLDSYGSDVKRILDYEFCYFVNQLPVYFVNKLVKDRPSYIRYLINQPQNLIKFTIEKVNYVHELMLFIRFLTPEIQMKLIRKSEYNPLIIFTSPDWQDLAETIYNEIMIRNII